MLLFCKFYIYFYTEKDWRRQVHADGALEPYGRETGANHSARVQNIQCRHCLSRGLRVGGVIIIIIIIVVVVVVVKL